MLGLLSGKYYMCKLTREAGLHNVHKRLMIKVVIIFTGMPSRRKHGELTFKNLTPKT